MKNGNKLPTYLTIEKKIEIAQRLRNLRHENKYTQDFVAEKVDVSVKTYRSWEIDFKENIAYAEYPIIDCEKIIKLSNLYNVSVDYILCKSDFTSPENDFVGHYTELSETALSTLLRSTPYEKRILNTLLANNFFIQICFAIYKYMQIQYKKIEIKDKSTENEIISEAEQKDIAEYRATKHFAYLLTNQLSNNAEMLKINRDEHTLEAFSKIIHGEEFGSNLQKLEDIIPQLQKLGYSVNDICDMEENGIDIDTVIATSKRKRRV